MNAARHRHASPSFPPMNTTVESFASFPEPLTPNPIPAIPILIACFVLVVLQNGRISNLVREAIRKFRITNPRLDGKDAARHRIDPVGSDSLYRLSSTERKKDFLSRHSKRYGYSDSPCGFIDSWRGLEFPSLVSPLNSNGEVYLDYAGSALPGRTQLSKTFDGAMKASQILGNPHSFGPAAARTSLLIEESKLIVMRHFGCLPTPDGEDGYDVIFTSGATEALRLVASYFPWEKGSVLLYPRNAHTSVIGMREEVLHRGGTFRCESLRSVSEADIATLKTWSGGSAGPHLRVLPLECNFGGTRCVPSAGGSWYTFLDVAKAASTSDVNLRNLNADFACVSFYKMFGHPTGLGALFVKKSSGRKLLEWNDGSRRHYFGGGSVDAVLPGSDFAILNGGMTHGTVHFRGIASLKYGFEEIQRVGGMKQVKRHTVCLAAEFAMRLRRLRHANDNPVVVIYGPWSSDSLGPHPDIGPTVPFNVLRHDGTYVGYSEISKLAGLRRMQIRTGCFCNPGACQDALNLTDQGVVRNYHHGGHKCGDGVDIVDGKPTGAVRVSFGKDSLWDDMDLFIGFLKRYFVQTNHDCHQEEADTIDPSSLTTKGSTTDPLNHNRDDRLQNIYIFPIKSCAAQHAPRWKIHQKTGRLKYDREFALVSASSGNAMRLSSYPKMALIRPIVDMTRDRMIVRAPHVPPLTVHLNRIAHGGRRSVKVCGDACEAKVWDTEGRETADWFTAVLGVECYLARCRHPAPFDYEPTTNDPMTKELITNESMTNEPTTIEPTPNDPSSGDVAKRTPRDSQIAFANEAPLLLVSQESVDVLNSVLGSMKLKKVDARHFRPNFVVKNASLTSTEERAWRGRDVPPNAEDSWSGVSIPNRGMEFSVVGKCARCSMVDYDPTSGMKGDTLLGLADYRRCRGQIYFGILLRGSDGHEFSENGVTAGEDEIWVEEGDVVSFR